MITNRPQRRTTRLHPDLYRQPNLICSITIAVSGRRSVFGNHAVAAAAVQVLKSHATSTDVRIYAFCVMPDHVHFLLSPSEKCDDIAFVGQFKNLAQRAAWRLDVKGAFWQGSFWDHFVRRQEDLVAATSYILNNPVRKGLVGRWQDYAFSGSLVYDLSNWLGA